MFRGRKNLLQLIITLIRHEPASWKTRRSQNQLSWDRRRLRNRTQKNRPIKILFFWQTTRINDISDFIFACSIFMTIARCWAINHTLIIHNRGPLNFDFRFSTPATGIRWQSLRESETPQRASTSFLIACLDQLIKMRFLIKTILLPFTNLLKPGPRERRRMEMCNQKKIRTLWLECFRTIKYLINWISLLFACCCYVSFFIAVLRLAIDFLLCGHPFFHTFFYVPKKKRAREGSETTLMRLNYKSQRACHPQNRAREEPSTIHNGRIGTRNSLFTSPP